VRAIGEPLRQGNPAGIAVQAGLAQVDGLEAEAQGRRAGPQAEIALSRVHELRVGNHRTRVVALGLPGCKVPAREHGRPGGAPVQIPPQFPVAVFPNAAQHLRHVGIDEGAFTKCQTE
jgi:hypothetical protein